MAAEIYVEPDDIWVFFRNNKSRLKDEMVLIAENGDTEYEVYLTANNEDTPSFLVYKGDIDIEQIEATGTMNCEEIARLLFSTYLEIYEEICKDLPLPEGLDDVTQERQEEMKYALRDFLSVVFQDGEASESIDDDVVELLLDDILESLNTYLYFPYTSD